MRADARSLLPPSSGLFISLFTLLGDFGLVAEVAEREMATADKHAATGNIKIQVTLQE